ncbi:hypothetical protein M427DRAFT_139215 [Gonapodya prolifera JEL478]|uniref:C2H2-type domain-containing protein n=1 Tax=Gonapodya prolifera (strain JEL478) TaxID=1344416 RepID=A0A139A2M8_GONPJ|nr:hypothetical protein M427DRAFT_139215 [Gonapodya prolifera JEL478]|eukprot:KXS10603.1 hypothetical protein M427DRAFT_139215 [Gonapodya prolifera JEL478]
MGRGRGGALAPSTMVVDSWVKSFPCPKCSRVFTRRDVMVRHTKRRICGQQAALRATERLIGEVSERTQTVGPTLVQTPRPEGKQPATIPPSAGQRRPVSILDALLSPYGDIPPSNLIGPSRYCWSALHQQRCFTIYNMNLYRQGGKHQALHNSVHPSPLVVGFKTLHHTLNLLHTPSIPRMPFSLRLPI